MTREIVIGRADELQRAVAGGHHPAARLPIAQTREHLRDIASQLPPLAIAREVTRSGCSGGAATMHRTPARSSDRATVTIFRGSAPTMMTVGASPAPARGERARDDVPLCTSAASRRAELLFEKVGVDEELARPAQVLEFSVLAIHGERSLHAASHLGFAVHAHSPAKIRIRATRRVREHRLAGDLIEKEPAVCDLRRAGETRPSDGSGPIRVEPPRQNPFERSADIAPFAVSRAASSSVSSRENRKPSMSPRSA